jgi:ribosomal protein S18 acetylase RimI-like enzyme
MRFADAEECCALDQRCFRDGEAYDLQTFRDLLSWDSVLAYKALSADSRMTGFVVGVVEVDRTGHVVVLAVAPEWRRRGVATALMDDLETAFRARGVTISHLEVRTTNAGAQQLYHRLGYCIAGRKLAYYTNGDDGFLMVKDLSVRP